MNNEKRAMQLKISAVAFALWELHIYLDTHPNDTEAIKKYQELDDQRRALLKEYEEKFGPLYLTLTADSWEWVNSPWPWENKEEK